jgi:hypothetical protein
MPAAATTERRVASPWDALLRAPRPPSAVSAAGDITSARPGTKLALLLAELAEACTATTLRLAVCTDLTPRQVWGLLKAPRSRGQVTFHAGRWQLVAGWHGSDVERAAALLRSRGWRVEPPAPTGQRA